MEWPVRYEQHVTWRDVDAAGHVNNAVYFTYMENARVLAYARMTGRDPNKAWRLDEGSLREIDIIVASQRCDYRTPAFAGETLLVDVTPTRVGNTSFELGYRFKDRASGRLVAEGATALVAYDWKAARKKPIAPALRERLEAGLAKL